MVSLDLSPLICDIPYYNFKHEMKIAYGNPNELSLTFDR